MPISPIYSDHYFTNRDDMYIDIYETLVFSQWVIYKRLFNKILDLSSPFYDRFMIVEAVNL